MSKKSKKNNYKKHDLNNKIIGLNERVQDLKTNEVVEPAKLEKKSNLESEPKFQISIKKAFRHVLAVAMIILFTVVLMPISAQLIAVSVNKALEFNGILSRDAVLIATVSFVTSIFWLVFGQYKFYKKLFDFTKIVVKDKK